MAIVQPLGWFMKRENCVATPRGSDGGAALRILRGAVNRLDHGDTSPPFDSVACRSAMLPDRVEKILQCRPMSPKIANRGRSRALICILRRFVEPRERGRYGDPDRGIFEIGGDDAIVFQGDRTFSTGNFDASRITGKSRRSSVEYT